MRQVKGSLALRARRRLVRAGRWLLLRILGRQLRCTACGLPLFRGVPLVWRGRLTVIGSDDREIRVAFNSRTSLEFRHMQLDECPAPERPWVSESEGR